jgi:hypothetical protein
MGTRVSIGDRFTHRGQHRTLSPKAKVVPYAYAERIEAVASTDDLQVDPCGCDFTEAYGVNERKRLWLLKNPLF